ncbi:hypothetical protein [Amycolatopsis aidingensis]|uniref:hypothetical protein n=1 Tax=Amycolatopsis aidingensis TaxID=2842453 RepID=UPI001E62247C|nr:hypothetical protein [Amycolatopsis aidingensis]
MLITGVSAAAPGSAGSAAEPLTATAGPVLVQETTGPEDGPTLDPTTEADADKSKNKIIVGVIAAVLLVIVVLGRRARNKKKSG